MERIILDKLNWDLHTATPLDFLHIVNSPEVFQFPTWVYSPVLVTWKVDCPLFWRGRRAALSLCCCFSFSLVLGSRGCRACGLSSCGSWTLEHRLSSCGKWAWLPHGMWDLPRSGIKAMSPALAGRFSYHWATREVPWPLFFYIQLLCAAFPDCIPINLSLLCSEFCDFNVNSPYSYELCTHP